MLTRNNLAALLLVALVAYCAPSYAEIINADPSSYLALLNSLQPGDVLQLAPGTYEQGLPLVANAGTAAAPIVIRGPEGQSAVFVARDCRSTVQLDRASYVEVSNLRFEGGCGSAVAVTGNSHHITLESLQVIGYPTGVTTDGTTSKLTIRNSTIVDTDMAMDLSNSDAMSEANAVLNERRIKIAAAGSPTVTITASPSSINSGDTALLSWTSTDAGACAASQGWTGTRAASGTQTVGPLQQTTSFQLDCFGNGGQASSTVTVTVGAGGGGGGTTPTPNPPSGSAMSSKGGGGAFDPLSALALLTMLGASCRSTCNGARRSAKQ